MDVRTQFRHFKPLTELTSENIAMCPITYLKYHICKKVFKVQI